jgi:hypothetical protein
MAYRTNAGEPTPPRRLARSSRTLVRLLAICIGIYLVADFYLSAKYFAAIFHAPLGLAHPPPHLQIGLMLLPLFLLPVLLVVMKVGGGSSSRWWEQAAALIRGGELERAAEGLARAAEQTKHQVQIHAMVLIAYGDVQLRMGRLDEARECLRGLEAEGVLKSGFYADWLKTLLIVSSVAAGDVDDAVARLERWPEAHPWAKAVVAARLGRYDEAATSIRRVSSWEREIRDACFDERGPQVLAAFASARGERTEAAGQLPLASLHYLAGRWPELAAFLG